MWARFLFSHQLLADSCLLVVLSLFHHFHLSLLFCAMSEGVIMLRLQRMNPGVAVYLLVCVFPCLLLLREGAASLARDIAPSLLGCHLC